MFETHLRQAAAALLECAIRIAPADARGWGEAMRAELNQVESAGAALMWSLGGAGVLARQAVFSFLTLGRRQGIPPGPSLFARDVPVRRAMLIGAVACVFGGLLFFAAPPFRQAFRVAISPWAAVIHLGSLGTQTRLTALATRAERRRDAEGLAFCAVRVNNASASARLADEAVALDPKLMWIYAVVAARHPRLSEIARWIPELERNDLRNAFLPLIQAARIDVNSGDRSAAEADRDKDAAWQAAMSAAFRLPEFDDYLDRVAALDRRVVLRYRFDDPQEVLGGEQETLPVTADADSRRYAASLIRSGKDLDARGNRKNALTQYWAVARYGELLDARGHSGLEHDLGTSLQATAYRQLQALSRKDGNQPETALLGYLSAKFDAAASRQTAGWLFGLEICKRNASVVLIAGLSIVIFGGLLAISTAFLFVASRARNGLARQTAKTGAAFVAMISAVGLLLSSSALYLTYRPYWYIFQSAILTGDRTQARDLRAFLDAVQLGFGIHLHTSPEQRSFLYAGIILLVVTGIGLFLRRHFRDRTRVDRLHDSPPVP